MTIRVFPSLADGRPIETHEGGGKTIYAWLLSEKADPAAIEDGRAEIRLNGEVIPAAEYSTTIFSRQDTLDIRYIPHGGAFRALGSILGSIFNVAFGWLMPKTATPTGRTSVNGEKIENSSASANVPKMGEVVPEIAGRHRVYPPYLTAPYRCYVNKREQHLRFLACVGVGRYAFNSEDIKVGDTPFNTLGDTAHYDVYQPGADLSGELAADNWYTTEEVGGTSSGTPGLILSTETASRENVDEGYSTYDNAVQRAAGEWPSAWGTGTVVRVELPRAYQVVTVAVPPTEEAAGYEVSEITGWFGHLPSTSVGQRVSLGAFGTTQSYLIRSSVSAGAGLLTISLENDEGDPVLLTPPGAAVILMFGSNINREILSIQADQTLYLSPGGFSPEGVFLSQPNMRIAYDSGLTYGEWTAEFVCVPGDEKTETIECDVFFPRGLARLSDSGDPRTHTVNIQIQYRDIDTGVRVTIAKEYVDATVDEIGFTERILLTTPIRPAVRVRRISSSSTSPNIVDECLWYALKAKLPTVYTYPGWTTMAVFLKSGGKLGASSENKINGVFTRILPEVASDGSLTAETPTRDIAAFTRYIVSTLDDPNEQIDMDELAVLGALWKSRGENFDFVFDETTVKEALSMAFAAGMGEFTIDNGLITPVREGVRTVFEQPYSAQGFAGPLTIEAQLPKPGDYDGVDVEYVDETTWTKNTISCLLPGDTGFKRLKVTPKGVTSKVNAWRIGMRARRAQVYTRYNYSFQTELAALNSRYLGYIPIVSDEPGYGRSMLMTGIESGPPGSVLVSVSEPLEWVVGENYVMAYRNKEGRLVGPFAAWEGPDKYSLYAALTGAWPEVTLKHELPHVYFGTENKWSFPALVTVVRPGDNSKITVNAKGYDERNYASDDDFPPV